MVFYSVCIKNLHIVLPYDCKRYNATFLTHSLYLVEGVHNEDLARTTKIWWCVFVGFHFLWVYLCGLLFFVCSTRVCCCRMFSTGHMLPRGYLCRKEFVYRGALNCTCLDSSATCLSNTEKKKNLLELLRKWRITSAMICAFWSMLKTYN